MSVSSAMDRSEPPQRPIGADSGQPFAIEMVHVGAQALRVGRQAGHGGVPLLLFNGIGGNIELFAPIARSMPGREVIISIPTTAVTRQGGRHLPDTERCN
jgi:hypothetical protein